MKLRQGDVLISKVGGVKGKKKENKDGLVLAYGEVTGHRHLVVCEKDGAELYEENGTLYLHVEEEATLFHGTTDQIKRQRRGEKFDFAKEDCHAPVALPKGDFEIKIQREYEPGGWRQVAD